MRRPVVGDRVERQACQRFGEAAGVPDRRARGDELRRGAVMRGDASQPPKDVRDVRAEDAPKDVHLIDDDDRKVLEEHRPPVVCREDADVEHVGVRDDYVGRSPRPRALGARRIAVVHRCARGRESERAQLPDLILCERLSREQVQGGRPRICEQPLERRQLIDEALPAGGSRRYRNVATGARSAQPFGLVRPEPFDPASPQSHRQLGGDVERPCVRRRARGDVLEVHEALFVIAFCESGEHAVWVHKRDANARP